MGRPSEFTQAIGDMICGLIAEGNSLNKICQSDEMPHRATVYRWLRQNDDFSDNYTRAKEDAADWFAEQIVEIADSEEDPNKARVRIDARKWIASKLKSKNYGEKQQMEVSGKDGAPLTPVINVTVGSEPTPASEAE